MRTSNISIKDHSAASGTLSIRKRDFERITKSIFVRLVSGTSRYPGIILNLSEKGMYITTKGTFLLDPRIKIIIPMKKEYLNLQGKIQSVVKSGMVYHGIGIELLKPSQSYLNFISNLRTLYN